MDFAEIAGRIFARVNVTAACVQTLGVIASPIVLMRSRKEEEKRGGTYDLDPALAAFLELVDGLSEAQRTEENGPQLVELGCAVTAIRTAMAALPDKRNNVDRAIVEMARKALENFGIPEPPGGWEKFAGVEAHR